MNKAKQQMISDITDYISSGQTHSTLVGMQFTISHQNEDTDKAKKYAEYIVDLITSAENYRRNNVKTGKNHVK